jgi:hypothetical protein
MLQNIEKALMQVLLAKHIVEDSALLKLIETLKKDLAWSHSYPQSHTLSSVTEDSTFWPTVSRVLRVGGMNKTTTSSIDNHK